MEIQASFSLNTERKLYNTKSHLVHKSKNSKIIYSTVLADETRWVYLLRKVRTKEEKHIMVAEQV